MLRPVEDDQGKVLVNPDHITRVVPSGDSDETCWVYFVSGKSMHFNCTMDDVFSQLYGVLPEQASGVGAWVEALLTGKTHEV